MWDLTKKTAKTALDAECPMNGKGDPGNMTGPTKNDRQNGEFPFIFPGGFFQSTFLTAQKSGPRARGAQKKLSDCIIHLW
jgi:hypothetical protein